MFGSGSLRRAPHLHLRRHGVWALAATVLALSGCAPFPPFTGHADRAQHSDAPAYRLIQEPDAGYRPIIDLIRAARHSLRLAVYELSDDDAITALLQAHHQRHVEVKVLLDSAFHGRQTNQGAYVRLHESGVDVTWAPPDVIYHEKVIVADDTLAVVGTANLVAKFYASSRDAFVITTARADVIAISATFDADYYAAANNPPGSTTTATAGDRLIWSPAARMRIVDQIDSATQSLIITTEELKDRAVLSAIAHAAQRGVACRIIVPQDPAATQAINDVSAAGCSVHLMPASASTLYMHEKILLTDNASLIIGSHNLSTASLLDNRELSLRLDATIAPDVLTGVQVTFDHDYGQAHPAPASAH